jgi:uncharacterized DUF497 family protein
MFSWDTAKAISNFEKHRISFEEAVSAFVDSLGLDWKDTLHSFNEERRKRLAKSSLDNILLIIYTVRRLRNGKETIRIISARKASKKERKAYFG